MLRDNTGLGFSIAGGLGAAPFKEGSESLFVSKITDGGTAHRDGKLRVGDKIVQINGVDVSDARHDQVYFCENNALPMLHICILRYEHVESTSVQFCPRVEMDSFVSQKLYHCNNFKTQLYFGSIEDT